MTTFTLWGETITAGDTLRNEQRAQLEIISQNAKVLPHVKSIVDEILAQEGKSLSWQNTLVLSDPLPDSAPATDEITYRAREAFIQSGFMPGMEEAIRRGSLDHLSGVQTAALAMRDLNVEVTNLPAMSGQVPITVEPDHSHRFSIWDHILHWLSRQQHRFVRMYALHRDTAMRERNLAMAAELAHVNVKIENVTQNSNYLQKKNEKLKTDLAHHSVSLSKLRGENSDHLGQIFRVNRALKKAHEALALERAKIDNINITDLQRQLKALKTKALETEKALLEREKANAARRRAAGKPSSFNNKFWDYREF